MKIRKTLRSWLNTKYLLILRNEENFEEKTSFKFTYSGVIFLLFMGGILTILFSIFLVTGVFRFWLDPRHEQLTTKNDVLALQMKIDSLEGEWIENLSYYDRIKKVLRGEVVKQESSVGETNRQEGIKKLPNISLEIHEIDSQFRTQFDSESSYPTANRNPVGDFGEIYLFSPISGVVTQKFKIDEEHFGVDIVSEKNEPIRAVSSGTVVMSSWTLDYGYVLGIQHKSNILSVYKHNSELFKEIGEVVEEGEVIAIIGNTGELTTGTHLHFELWVEGTPVDPEDYIAF